MIYKDLQSKLSVYFPAFVLDGVFPRQIRKVLRRIFYPLTGIFIILCLIIGALFFFENFILNIISFQIVAILYALVLWWISQYGYVLYGTTCVITSITMLLFALEAFYYSLYFKDISVMQSEVHISGCDRSGSFLLARVLYSSPQDDLVRGLFASPPGWTLAVRLGIDSEVLKTFLINRTTFIDGGTIRCTETDNSIFSDYVLALYQHNEEFKNFLFSQGIQEKELVGTIEWIVSSNERVKKQIRFWGKDNLGKVQGVGKSWSQGPIYEIEKYGVRLDKMYNLSYRNISHVQREEEMNIEAVLSRSSEANVVLVSDDETARMDPVVALAQKIFNGTSVPSLEHKMIIMLDTDALISATAEKTQFEQELMRIFNQAVRVGYVILVIPNFPAFLMSAQSLGSDVVSLIDPYVASSRVQIIAMSDKGNYHALIENNAILMQRFETILIEDDNEVSLVKILEMEVGIVESQNNVIFSYPALVAVAEGVSRYYMGQILSDKARDIMADLPQSVLQQGKSTINKSDVDQLIAIKTGIPSGEMSVDEREKLVNLETMLHERVVGQDEAVNAISSALRRARSGIGRSNRPIGSFLFMGPTGVGKTETTKALAEVFFGNEDKILRLDMSEYSSSDALTRLIGSFGDGKTGILVSLLHENPYGVLLLDEFEKSTTEVRDLFLQILDEGVFSDMMGKKVNARNLMIIATSNAGSDIIWETVKQGGDLVAQKDTVINTIIAEGIFRPELLNRFDGVILFHPLLEAQLRSVAEKMLLDLQKRLTTKGIHFEITGEVIDYLVSVGSDPKFGARSLNRAVQDTIEELVAQKIIRGEIVQGSSVTLTKEELESVH